MSRSAKPKSSNPLRNFNSSPEVSRLVVMMYVRFPLSLRDVEDLLFERDIDICLETVRHWWNTMRAALDARDPDTSTSTLKTFVIEADVPGFS